GAVLRAARVRYFIDARRQQYRFAIGAIDLRLEEEIRREALGLRRIHSPQRIAYQERRCRGLVVRIKNAQRDSRRRPDREQDVDLAAETEILRPLAHVERELRFAFPAFSRVQLQDP